MSIAGPSRLLSTASRSSRCLRRSSALPAAVAAQASFFPRRAARALSSNPSASSAHPLEVLSSRSLLKATTSSALHSHLAEAPRTIYVGLDPSAASLHLGNLLPLLALWHLREAGHNGVVLIGGATGSIGDPSGRSTERNALSAEELAVNIQGITTQVHAFFGNVEAWIAEQGEAVSSRGKLNVVNNADWYEGVGVLQFLRDVGRYARVGQMLARDSVKSRMTPTEQSSTPAGLSFTEFSYQLLQAYDFSVLHREPWHCTVQLGGSDQLGNITAGIDLILRQQAHRRGDTSASDDAIDTHDNKPMPAYGVTLPLLTTSSGAKFGKSAGNAVWLDASLTSDFDLYQHLLRSTDADVSLYLRALTLLPFASIEATLERHAAEPSARIAQKALADALVGMIRGSAALARAKTASSLLYDAELATLQPKAVHDAFAQDPRFTRLDTSDLAKSLIDLAVKSGVAASKGEARRAITAGGFYLNNARVTDTAQALQAADFQGGAGQEGAFALLRVGKTGHRVLWLEK